MLLNIYMENKTKLVVLGLIKNDKNQYLLSQRYDLDVPEAHLKWVDKENLRNYDFLSTTKPFIDLI